MGLAMPGPRSKQALGLLGSGGTDSQGVGRMIGWCSLSPVSSMLPCPEDRYMVFCSYQEDNGSVLLALALP